MITRVESTPYRVSLRQPLLVGPMTLTERSGLLIEIQSADGHVGFGEAAPLPSLHRESLDRLGAELTIVPRALAEYEVRNVGDLRTALARCGTKPSPSLQFAIEMAWLNLQAKRRGCTMAHVLHPEPNATVPVAALFDGDIAQARRALDDGALQSYPVVKVKVGRRGSERALINLLLAELPGATLRLDGNRALSLAEARSLVKGADTSRFEYFEEPLRDPTELPALHGLTGVSVALDETLFDARVSRLHRADCVAAWVLKPTLLGGLSPLIETAARARNDDIDCVISSCFESGLALWSLTQLAACLGNSCTAAGVGTDAWLAEDLIDPPFSSANGSLAIADAVLEPRVDSTGSTAEAAS